jgi:hypothetical protein
VKLISFKRREDFGTELYTQILHTKRWALLQASVSWNDYTAWPYIQIKSGNGSLLSIMFWAYKFGFDIGVCEHSWNFEYLEDLDVEEDETTT